MEPTERRTQLNEMSDAEVLEEKKRCHSGQAPQTEPVPFLKIDCSEPQLNFFWPVSLDWSPL